MLQLRQKIVKKANTSIFCKYIEGGSTIKKLSDQLEDKLEQDENYRMARKYMNMYTDSMVDEYRFRKENKVLIEKLDEMVDALHEVRDELGDVKRQNSQLSQSIRCLDFTRLTISMAGNTTEEWSELIQSMPENLQRTMPSVGEELPPPVPEPEPEPKADPLAPYITHETMPGMPSIRIVPPPKREAPFGADNLPPTPPPRVAPPTAQTTATVAAQQLAPDKKNRLFSIVSNLLFYFCMGMLIISAVSFAQNEDVNKSLFGYRYYYIKSASMVPVYPVGSVVLTRAVEPDKVQVGDDITVYVGDGKEETYLTHRVVEITTDQVGELAFRTKGVNNKANDPSPYNAKLMVGRVVLCVPVLGTVMTFVQNQLWLVIVMFVLLMALSFMLRLLFTKDPQEQGAHQAAASVATHGKFFRTKEKVTPTINDTRPPA